MSRCKIKEFVTQLRGVSYKPTDVTDATNGTPILRANNIQDDGMVYDDLVYIKSEKVKQTQKLQAGDIVICTSSGSKTLVGKASIFTGYSKVISFGAFCKALRINDVAGINKDFIRLFFSSKLYREQIASSSIGANINNIKSENIDDLDINVPTPEVQSIAVKTLTQLNRTILSKKEQLKQLDELVKSRFIEMFGQYFEDENNLCKLEEICNATIGLTYKPTNVSSTGTIVLRSGNIQDNELYLQDDIVRVSNIKINDDKYIRENDILMCSRNGSARLVGKSCLITKIQEPMSFGAFMTVIRCEYPYFLQAFFSSDYFKQQLTGTQTASVNQITTKMLYNYVVIKPKKEDENTFAEFVKQVDKSKFIVQKQIEDLQELLDSKMDEYFG